MVLSSLRRRMPLLAKAIHDANQPNPISIGPMLPIADDDRAHAVDIGCVADELTDPLMRGLPRARARILLGTTPYDVREVDLVAQATFDELAARPEGRAVPLRMLTPTAHHTPGPVRRAVVVPDPVLYVGSWLRRWNLYAPDPFDDSLLEAVANQAAIRAFQGGTSAVRLGRMRTFIGFTGTVELTILDGHVDAAAVTAAVWALARLAEFCGTGVETTRGMGQTRLDPSGTFTAARAAERTSASE